MKTIVLWALIGIFCLRCSAEARDAVPSVQTDSGDESVSLPAEFYGIYILDMRPAYGRNYQVYHLCPERVYVENHLADGRVIEEDLQYVRYIAYDEEESEIRGKLDTGFHELHVLQPKRIVYSFTTETGFRTYELRRQPCG